MSEDTPATLIRGMRRQRQWSQEDLAEHAGLSLTTIKKAECGGKTVTTATLHAIAQAFDVATTDLYANRVPRPLLDVEPDHQALARLRSGIAPPVQMDGQPMARALDGPVDLEAIRSTIARIEAFIPSCD